MAGALPRSPLAPERLPDLAPIAGVRLAAAACGLKKTGAPDVLFVALDPGTSAAGVYTRSRCPSAPVDWCRRALTRSNSRVSLIGVPETFRKPASRLILS